MIWGVTLQPGEFYAEVVKDEIQLSMAALESRKKKAINRTEDEKTEDSDDFNQVIMKTESSEYVLCTLVHGILFQQYLDMRLMPGEQITFTVEGKCSVHLTGYSYCSPAQGEDQPYDSQGVEEPLQTSQEEGQDTNEIIQDIKEEPPEIDIIEVIDDNSPSEDMEQEYSKPSVRVSPVRTNLPSHEPFPNPIIQEDLKPTMAQKAPMTNRGIQRSQTQMMSRGKRRFTPSQRSQFRRGPTPQQRRNQRGMLASQSRPNQRRGGVQPPTSQHFLPQTQQLLGLQQQNIKMESNQRLPQEEAMSQQPSFPIQVGGLQDFNESQNITSNFQAARNSSNLGDGIVLSDPSNISIKSEHSIGTIPVGYNVDEQSYSDTSGDYANINVIGMPAGSSSLQELSNMNIPGTSQQGGGGLQWSSGRNWTATPSIKKEPVGSGAFRCQFCDQSFRNNALLKGHELQDHSDIIKRQCSICSKVLSSVQALKEHLLIHSGERPHTCQFCSKTFRQIKALKNHEKTHSGELPHVCRFCGLTFKERFARVDHERQLHQMGD